MFEYDLKKKKSGADFFKLKNLLEEVPESLFQKDLCMG